MVQMIIKKVLSGMKTIRTLNLHPSYHEFMYKSVECGIVKFKNEPWKGRRTYYFLDF